jgi:hypothetical protein
LSRVNLFGGVGNPVDGVLMECDSRIHALAAGGPNATTGIGLRRGWALVSATAWDGAQDSIAAVCGPLRAAGVTESPVLAACSAEEFRR